MGNASQTIASAATMPAEHRKVIVASGLGALFEWYDFYLYGALAAILAHQFFATLDPQLALVFALLGFAAGFVVRPVGALLFGRLGDLIGRKYTFLVTLLLMGAATFIVGLLPGHETIGVAAPLALVVLRLLQGLAIGGEYGGVVTYVAEHAPPGKRGAYTGWIQTTATLGLLLALLVIATTRGALGEAAFADWGWRIPFLLSALLLVIGVWIRLSLKESPPFLRIKQGGRWSRSPLTEAFARWSNLKLVIVALFGLVAGQAVVWYTGQFQALFFLTLHLKVDDTTASLLTAIALALGTPLFVVFGALSDRVGRKPIILLGCLLAASSYFPLFEALTRSRQPRTRRRAGEGVGHADRATERMLVAVQSARRQRREQRVRHRPAAARVARRALQHRGWHRANARDDRRSRRRDRCARHDDRRRRCFASRAERRARCRRLSGARRPGAHRQAESRRHRLPAGAVRDDGLRADRRAAGRDVSRRACAARR